MSLHTFEVQVQLAKVRTNQDLQVSSRATTEDNSSTRRDPAPDIASRVVFYQVSRNVSSMVNSAPKPHTPARHGCFQKMGGPNILGPHEVPPILGLSSRGESLATSVFATKHGGCLDD